jgi:hypothetical protein
MYSSTDHPLPEELMTQIEQQMIETFRSLPLEKQEELLNFAEFLKAKLDHRESMPAASISAFDAAGDLIGCVEGPDDLSTNKEYMKGFGQS